MSRQRQKGTRMETAMARYLGLDRAPLRGSKDTGDLTGTDWVIEVKNHNSYDIAGWMGELEREMANAGSELGCVIFHRRGVDPVNNPGGQFVLMPAATFKSILWKGDE